ncbi:DNA polymerase I [Campylobacter sp. 19-13652]|uniref:DNA polymerase I n=1 Tax=Campylobacter sp. 19-13652 TaxID=2840180 RepID=UPI001C752AD3|nr:DNA polymerase I [Campylobacter sp. 19-13652]BCX79886.1 DNA polymerase [Campylobacter sp. 19-13652]
MKTLTVIDTFGFFFRLYYAMPNLRTRSGLPSGMVSGFASFILSLADEFKSDYLIFALDSKGQTKRHEMLGEYKANRSAPPPELKAQLGVCIDMIEKMGLVGISREGFEADDIIASVVKQCENEDIFVRIVTHDKDLYQLIKDGKSAIYSPQSKTLYDEAACAEKYGVAPHQIRDFLALTGDSSDNVPGVKGIGAKGAKKLLDEFGDLESIYQNIAFISNARTQAMLAEGKESAMLSKRLVTLFDDADVGDIKKATFPSTNPLIKIPQILQEYELNKILKQLRASSDDMASSANLGFEAITLDTKEKLENALSGITNETIVAFDTETTDIDSRSASIVGFSFSFNSERAYYVPIAHSYLGVGAQVDKQLASWAVEQIYKAHVVGHNLKYDFEIVQNNLGLIPPKNYTDTMLLAWLERPGESVGMDALALRLFSYETVKFESIVSKKQTFADVEIAQASKYAAEDAWITLRFYEYFMKNLPAELLDEAHSVEMPFVCVLLYMQRLGIGLDRIVMRGLIEQNAQILKELSAKIYELAGEQFNINSTKQLGEVLFERLGLSAKKKTKTGYSTDESVLASLVNEHPIISELLSYREVYKLQSTYCEPLLALALKDSEHRIYTSFVQTGTATGRLSSKNPNLQNIPARGERAKAVREAFVPRRGYSFVGLDYSQIELRLLAHFSGDPALIRAFNEGQDIHSHTAMTIFGDSNSEHRAVAKSINFGLIYGMGSTKLADQLGIERKAAKEYIERYFAAFASIKSYLESIKTEARELGYVTTLLNRRRYFDFERATPMQLAMYEREAVNTRFQGSAADIIKLAMIRIYNELLDDSTRMLLQIHDELIFEVADERAQEFASAAQEIMSGVVRLNVPLLTSLSIAKNWGELK